MKIIMIILVSVIAAGLYYVFVLIAATRLPYPWFIPVIIIIGSIIGFCAAKLMLEIRKRQTRSS